MREPMIESTDCAFVTGDTLQDELVTLCKVLLWRVLDEGISHKQLVDENSGQPIRRHPVKLGNTFALSNNDDQSVSNHAIAAPMLLPAKDIVELRYLIIQNIHCLLAE